MADEGLSLPQQPTSETFSHQELRKSLCEACRAKNALLHHKPIGYLGSVHNFGQHAFLWQNGDSQEIGEFIARSVNEAGTVVGDELDVRTSRAMIYRDGEAKNPPPSQ